ncbi:MAG: NADP-dependent methylenetetrahydromethanopterin/methylenetetrahydrofolate dehydrogenase [Desulfosporosinus sp.]|nr:NADP-dependent methylenetetrahydromethanopterin/methylenetetrahydrofolate dehydrogenase [Desulfosporosinus sp.]
MKKILIQIESDPKTSVFDQITAYDAGVDQVLPYGEVQPEDVANLVYGAIFTRGGEELRNTAIFIGGTNVPAGEELMNKTLATFFGDFRVSVMLDANGCNTTAAALVHKIVHGRDLRAKKALVAAGTGPVGIRVATLLAQEGCEVYLSSRDLSRAREVCRQVEEKTGTKLMPLQVVSPEDMNQALEGVNIVACCGAPGVRLLDQPLWSSARTLEIIADLNAVAPLGVEGIKVTDNGKEREGKIFYGAIAIGNLKMKVHGAAVQALFERNDRILDVAEIYDLAKQVEG